MCGPCMMVGKRLHIENQAVSYGFHYPRVLAFVRNAVKELHVYNEILSYLGQMRLPRVSDEKRMFRAKKRLYREQQVVLVQKLTRIALAKVRVLVKERHLYLAVLYYLG